MAGRRTNLSTYPARTSLLAKFAPIVLAICLISPAHGTIEAATPATPLEPSGSRITKLRPSAAILQETLWISTTGSDSTGDGSESSPYRTIQHAFDQASNGDTIRVLPGTYNECLLLAALDQRSVSIVADAFLQDPENPDSRLLTVIDGTGECGFPFATVNIGGFDSRIEGFTITGGSASAIFSVGGVVITNNVITGNSSASGGGIYAYPNACYYGDMETTISNNTIENNTVALMPGFDFSGNGGGIFISAVTQVYIPGDPIFGFGCRGGGPTVTITDNIIRDNNAERDGGGVFFYTYSHEQEAASISLSSAHRGLIQSSSWVIWCSLRSGPTTTRGRQNREWWSVRSSANRNSVSPGTSSKVSVVHLASGRR